MGEGRTRLVREYRCRPSGGWLLLLSASRLLTGEEVVRVLSPPAVSNIAQQPAQRRSASLAGYGRVATTTATSMSLLRPVVAGALPLHAVAKAQLGE